MTVKCEELFPDELQRLQAIPGIKERAATSLIAEIGTAMDKVEYKDFQKDPDTPDGNKG